eukprot:97319-Chlamydomonas_euryale.AAC.1
MPSLPLQAHFNRRCSCRPPSRNRSSRQRCARLLQAVPHFCSPHLQMNPPPSPQAYLRRRRHHRPPRRTRRSRQRGARLHAAGQPGGVRPRLVCASREPAGGPVHESAAAAAAAVRRKGGG